MVRKALKNLKEEVSVKMFPSKLKLYSGLAGSLGWTVKFGIKNGLFRFFGLQSHQANNPAFDSQKLM